jgi:hypothetical protein
MAKNGLLRRSELLIVRWLLGFESYLRSHFLPKINKMLGLDSGRVDGLWLALNPFGGQRLIAHNAACRG